MISFIVAALVFSLAISTHAQSSGIGPFLCQAGNCDQFARCMDQIAECDGPGAPVIQDVLQRAMSAARDIPISLILSDGDVGANTFGDLPPAVDCEPKGQGGARTWGYKARGKKTFQGGSIELNENLSPILFCSTFVHELTNLVQQLTVPRNKLSVPLCNGSPRGSDPGDREAIANENIYRESCSCPPGQCCPAVAPRCYYGCCEESACESSPPAGGAAARQIAGTCTECGDGIFTPVLEQCDTTAPLDGQACLPEDCHAPGTESECTCTYCNPCAGKQAGDQCYWGAVAGGNGWCTATIEGDLVCHSENRIFCFQYDSCTSSSQCGTEVWERCIAMNGRCGLEGTCQHWIHGCP